jgi:hypothetical protein
MQKISASVTATAANRYYRDDDCRAGDCSHVVLHFVPLSAQRPAMTSAGRDARAARRGVWSIALLARVSSGRERNNFELNRRVDS